MKAQTRALLRQSPQPVAIVLGLDSVTSLGVIRSLGHRAIPVVGVGRPGQTLGGSSRYCTLCEAAETEAEVMGVLLALSQEACAPPVVFAESDEHLLLLDRHRDALSGLRWLPTLDRPLPELINKRTMLALAREAGLPLPVTLFSDELPREAIAQGAAYPCFVKPLYTQGHYRSKGEVATGPQELLRIVQDPRFTGGYLAQEIIPGPVSNLFFFLTYCDAACRPLATITGHKLRQLPPEFGIGTLAQSERHPEVTRLSQAFLKGIGFHGLADLEFKFDPRDQRYKFIEINPRPCGLIELASAAGLDMPYLAYLELTNGTLPAPLPQAPDGLVWMSLLDDLTTCLKYGQGHRVTLLGDWLSRLRRHDCDALFAVEDLRPFLFRVWSLIVRQVTGHAG